MLFTSKADAELNTLKARVGTLEKHNAELQTLNETLREENEEMSATLQSYAQAKVDAPKDKAALDAEIEDKASRLAAEIIASQRVPEPVSVQLTSPDAPQPFSKQKWEEAVRRAKGLTQ